MFRHTAQFWYSGVAAEWVHGEWLAGSAAVVRRHVEGLRDAAAVKLAVLQTALDSMGETGERRCNPGAPTL